MAARSTRPTDARAGRMLAVEVAPELLQSLRDEAARHDQPLAALVRRLLADGLQRRQELASADPDRVEALEAGLRALVGRVEALERPPGRTPRVTAASPPPAAPQPAQKSEPEPLADPVPLGEGEPVTTAELAERTGTNRAGWNNWAAGHAIGAIRRHRSAGNWRLVGRAPAPGGGPARWLWQPA